MNFEELGLDKTLTEQLASNGIAQPTLIQEGVFPILKAGESVIALSKTGTGKTLAYLTPLVQRYAIDLKETVKAGKAWGLVLVPTRELADQASKNLRLLSADKIQSVVIVGGESDKKQISEGESAAIIIATPGRLLDLLQRRQIDVSALQCVVFDEADRILDMGFIDDIRAIREMLPKKLQLCFFSATIHFGVDEMSYEFGVEAKRVGEEQDDLTVEGLDHRVAFVGDQEKLHAIVNFLKARPQERGIIFTNYRERAHDLVYRLKGLGLRAESLTAQLSQSERTRTMQMFRDQKVQVLVASDLASRGLDVEDLDFVVNAALPDDPATYLHRVGRTARAGKKGIALSLIGFDDTFRLERLEKFLGKEIVRFQFLAEELKGVLPRLSDRPERSPRPEQNTESQAAQRPAYVKAPYQARTPQQNTRAPQQSNNPQSSAPHARPHTGTQNKNTHASSQSSSRPNVQSKAASTSFFGKIFNKIKKLVGIEEAAAPSATSSSSSHSQQRRPHSSQHRPQHQGRARYQPGSGNSSQGGHGGGGGRHQGNRPHSPNYKGKKS